MSHDIETSLNWFKSSYSPNGGPNCVETARFPDSPQVAVRDSNQRERGYLTVAHGEWAAFLRTVKTGNL